MSAGLEKSFKYPLESLKIIGLGGLLILGIYILYFGAILIGTVYESASIIALLFSLPLIMLGSLIMLGYMVNVSRSIFNGEGGPPGLGNLRELLFIGLRTWIVLLFYIAVYVFLIVIGLLLISINKALILIALPIILVGLVVALSMWVGVIHFAKKDTIKEGIAFTSVLGIIKENPRNFIISILKSIIVGIAYGFTMIFIVTIPFAYFASYVSTQYIFTVFYMESLSNGEVR